MSDLKPRLPTNYPTRVTTTDLRLATAPEVIQCYEPATLAFLGTVRVTSPEEVAVVVAKGRACQALWGQSSWEARRHVLRMIKRAILAQTDDIVRLSCMDTGKPRMDAQFGEILASCGKLEWVIAEGERVLAPESRATNLTSLHKVARVEYTPLGVVGVIAPWNYPFYNMYNHIASGLFAGNAVVIKISEYSAWSGAHFITLVRDVLAAAGHSPDLVQLVQGFGETGAALVAAADKLVFTGSPGVGKAVMSGASKTLTPLVLELGGKDPFIVCDDASVDAALTLALRGTFQVGVCACECGALGLRLATWHTRNTWSSADCTATGGECHRCPLLGARSVPGTTRHMFTATQCVATVPVRSHLAVNPHTLTIHCCCLCRTLAKTV